MRSCTPGRSGHLVAALFAATVGLIACAKPIHPRVARPTRTGSPPAVVQVAPAPALVPRFEQGASPQVKVWVTRAVNAGTHETAHDVTIHVTGPESYPIHRTLGVAHSKACFQDGTCTEFYGAITISLGQLTRVGRYELHSVSPGLELRIDPPRFDIIAGAHVTVAPLARRTLRHHPYTIDRVVAGTPSGIVVVNNTASSLQVHTPGNTQTIKLDGFGSHTAAIGSSPAGAAIAYDTSNYQPKVVVLDKTFTRSYPVTVVPPRLSKRVNSRPSFTVSWDPQRAEWLVAWLSSETLSQREINALVGRGEWIPMGVSVARLVRVGRKRVVRRSLKLGHANEMSNLVWNGREHALVIADRWGIHGTWRLTLLQLRRGRVIRRRHFAYRRRCPRSAFDISVQLAWHGKRYVVAILEHSHIGLPGETPTRVVMVDLRARHPRPIEVVADPKREVKAVQLGSAAGVLWLVYKRLDERRRAQVIAASLGARLAIERALVIDDGYDGIIRVHGFLDSGRYRVAVFRKQGSVITLPSANKLTSLPGISISELHKLTGCARPFKRPSLF